MSKQIAPLLSIRNLSVAVRSGGREFDAVRGVSLDLMAGEVLAVVGESGSGKSLTALSVLGLLPAQIASVSGGEILYQGKNLVAANARELDEVRGAQISMIFQEPLSALNPVMKIGAQIVECLITRGLTGREEARRRALDALQRVRISEPERRMLQYPHELSGGMRQRVMIALALIASPRILIADEPTTALDVTVQAQVLDLMRSLQSERGLSMIIITHDLGAVADIADRVAVMYAGEIVETGHVTEILSRPKHPYTVGLLSCLPEFATDGRRLNVIEGSIAAPSERDSGCVFKDRCPLRLERECDAQIPLFDVGPQHSCRCVRPVGGTSALPWDAFSHA